MMMKRKKIPEKIRAARMVREPFQVILESQKNEVKKPQSWEEEKFRVKVKLPQ